jgi:hypothetical protein
MSDSYQELAFDNVASSDANSVATSAIGWMVMKGYVSHHLSDCVYGAQGKLGHAPGPNWRLIIDETRRWRGLVRVSDFAGTPPPGYDPRNDQLQFPNIFPNGVSARVGRTVCQAGENWSGYEAGKCPACNQELDPGVDLDALAGAWFEGLECKIECPSCQVASRLEDWDLQPYWAFAEASLTFWNWPPLSAWFVSDLSHALAHTRIRHVVGHV